MQTIIEGFQSLVNKSNKKETTNTLMNMLSSSGLICNSQLFKDGLPNIIFDPSLILTEEY